MNYGNSFIFVKQTFAMHIMFSHIGKQLVTRRAGSAVRNTIIEGIENNENIIFDFAGVEIVSNSFADECFAKLIFHFDLPNLSSIPHFKMQALL
jgi:hypothetical protein